ncbi:hypothetical protein AD947_07415 [Acetobacter tropicalis]|uniref:Terminase n=1 Tax=Acetobacter tropicalis TaxID=104102 RepID=A0A149TY09_9PROT|nr:hypothetical protein [Acetobacter tropicalis]KXV58008.1 hypothetical protein AD947_07415 [Acetobacter tropicalis]
MAEIKIPNAWSPRNYQRNLWDYLSNGGKRAIEIAHRRWGKDDVLLHHTACALFERPASYWSCLPEYAQARKALWTAINPHTGKRRIDEAFPHALRASTNEQEMFIRFVNGSTWQLVGSDRYNSLVGAGIAGVTFSEWALCNPSAWGYIRPMLQENDGWAAFITTPRGKNHAYSMFQHAERSVDWFAERSTILDTGALTPEQASEALAEYVSIYGEDIGQAQFEQEYLCSWTGAILGAFYARELSAVRNEGRLCQIEAIPGYPVHTSWDLGISDDTALWHFQVVGSQILVLGCHSQSGVGLDYYESYMRDTYSAKCWTKGIDYVPHDAKAREWTGGRTRIETMMAMGFNPQLVPNVGLMDGINAARRTIPLCVFDTSTEMTGFSALESYKRKWDDVKKAYSMGPEHDWASHYSDSFRYLALSWREARAAAPSPPATTMQNVLAAEGITPPKLRPISRRRR